MKDKPRSMWERNKLIVVDYIKNMAAEEVVDLIKQEDIAYVLDVIRKRKWKVALFGGEIRSLLMAKRIAAIKAPRDIDLVVDGCSLESLKEAFQDILKHETRFGGLRLQRGDVLFDVWPLDRTWAFQEDGGKPSFEKLPGTTFLNMESIAVDVSCLDDDEPEVYDGNGQFYDGYLDSVVELNREANPFPELCVVRSLIIADTIGFTIGPKLSQYIAKHGNSIPDEQLRELQEKHYGKIMVAVPQLRQWIDEISKSVQHNPGARFMLFKSS